MGYTIDGYMLEFCDCNILCPCWVGEDPDNGTCQGTLAWHINQGTIDGVDVAGRTYAALALLPGNVLDGNWRVLGVVDDDATDEQYDALVAAFGGEFGGPLGDLASLIGEVVAIKRAPITIDVTEGTGSLTIGDLVDAEMAAYQSHFGNATNLQESLSASHPGAPAYISKAGKYERRTEQYGIPDVDLEGHNAVQAMFHFET
jgi:hypothetical protein